MSSLPAHALYISHPQEARLLLHQQLGLLQASAALLFAALAVLQLLVERRLHLFGALLPICIHRNVTNYDSILLQVTVCAAELVVLTMCL